MATFLLSAQPARGKRNMRKGWRWRTGDKAITSWYMILSAVIILLITSLGTSTAFAQTSLPANDVLPSSMKPGTCWAMTEKGLKIAQCSPEAGTTVIVSLLSLNAPRWFRLRSEISANRSLPSTRCQKTRRRLPQTSATKTLRADCLNSTNSNTSKKLAFSRSVKEG